MRFLILSDLHANLEATRSVIEAAGRIGYDASVVLGDLVGYGGSPNDVIDVVRELHPAAIVRGNHDKVACGISEGATFHDVARRAALWTRETLSPDNASWLRELPEGPIAVEGFLIAHGSPLDEEDYILGESDAAHAFESLAFEVSFFGHTHFACLFEAKQGHAAMRMLGVHQEVLRLGAGARHLINPGSIGQPRDHDPRAAFAIFDTARREVEVLRAEYDLASAQRRIESAGLPPVLARRLALGV